MGGVFAPGDHDSTFAGGPINADAPDIARRALLEQRLLINATGRRTLRFVPPLVVSEDEIDSALVRLVALMRDR